MLPGGTRARPARGARFALAGVLAAFALAGPACDDDEPAARRPPASQGLTAAERGDVARAQGAVRVYCRRLGRFIARRSGPPPPATKARADAGVDRLVALARSKPGARYDTGIEMRTLLGDLAEDLEGAICAPDLVHRIDAALAEIPPR
jgi:hypothetical protein